MYSDFFRPVTYYYAVLAVCAFAPVFIATAYLFRFYVSEMVKRRKYGQAIIIFIAIYILGIFINYFTAGLYLGSVRFSIPVLNNFQHRLESANYNTRLALILGIVMLGIELAKSWYLKSQENLQMLKSKARAEMQIKKSRIHPLWLFRALDKIRKSLDQQSVMSTTMILNLSDLLSYSLYETDAELVKLEQELAELQHLLSIERSDPGALVNIDLIISGELTGKYLAPMSVINRVVEYITSLPGGLVSCHLHLKFTVGTSVMELVTEKICGDEKTISRMRWTLSRILSSASSAGLQPIT